MTEPSPTPQPFAEMDPNDVNIKLSLSQWDGTPDIDVEGVTAALVAYTQDANVVGGGSTISMAMIAPDNFIDAVISQLIRQRLDDIPTEYHGRYLVDTLARAKGVPTLTQVIADQEGTAPPPLPPKPDLHVN